MSCRQGIVGGYSARWSLKSFAQVGHTHLCNIVAMLGLSGWALAKNFNHVLGAMFLQEMLGNHNQVAMRTMLVTHGVKANMGKGEIVSCLAVSMSSPLTLGRCRTGCKHCAAGKRGQGFWADHLCLSLLTVRPESAFLLGGCFRGRSGAALPRSKVALSRLPWAAAPAHSRCHQINKRELVAD